MKRNQQQLNKRKEHILTSAMILAEAPGGWSRLTRDAIANAAECSTGLVSNYLGSMDDVRRSIIKLAIKRENYLVLAQAILCNEPTTRNLPAAVRTAALSQVR